MRRRIKLEPVDVVKLMRASGFSDKQIIKGGTDLRNALAEDGAARIRVGKMVEVIYAVDDPVIHISTHRHGSFIYDTKKTAMQ